MRIPKMFAVISLFAMLLSSAHADGMFLMKENVKVDPNSYAGDITEPLQKAFILYANGVETLILQVSYKGNVSEFAWLVPTPSRPHVERIQIAIFHHLHKYTAPEIKYWFDADKKLRGDYMGLKMAAAAPMPRGLDVSVLEEKKVGVYDIAVLKAGNAGDLLQWLKQNNYRVSSKASSVIANYISRGWVFTAMRVNPKHQVGAAKRLHEGVLQSLSFKFKAAEPIYPLKVSSVNKGKTDILLYVAAAHRVEEPLMKVKCSMDGYGAIPWDTPNELQRDYPDFFARLTKLTASLTQDKMTRDLVFKPAARDAILLEEPVSPPFLKNLGASCLLALDYSLTFPKTLFVLGFTSLVALTPFGRKRWRVWTAIGIAFVMAALLGDSQGTHWLIPILRKEAGFQAVGIMTLVLAGAVIAGISLVVVRCMRNKN